MGIPKRRPTVAPTQEDIEAKGKRKFTYEVDLDFQRLKPGEMPYHCTFEGHWSRHAVDTMLKHAIRGLKQHKRILLKEATNAGSDDTQEREV